jgi:hypothetical protein
MLLSCSSNAPTGQLGLPTERGTAAPTARPLTGAPGASASSGASRSPGASGSSSASPSASPSAAPPSLVSANASQVSLTVAYSGPMRTSVACATSGAPGTVAGSIDDPLHYRSSDKSFDEAVQSSSRVTVSGDCSTVTFLFDLAAPAGGFTITITAVQDKSGTPIDTGRAGTTVNVADQGRPQAAAATSTGDRITITYTEPMTQIGEAGGVTLAGNYRLDGAPLLGALLSCLDAGCRRVSLTLPGDTLVAGRSYQLRIANAVDRSGKNISPDPTTIAFKAG